MYWTTGRSVVVERIIKAINGGGSSDNPLEFDAACKADIAAARDAP
jgi:hypothetical protein